MPRPVITKKPLGIGEYQLSIDMDKEHLYIHEMVCGGEWNLCTGLFIHEYSAFRDMYASLRGIEQGILCVNHDYTYEHEGDSHTYVRRLYLARKREKWTIFDVDSVALHQITVSTEELDGIIAHYDEYLQETPKIQEDRDDDDIPSEV